MQLAAGQCHAHERLSSLPTTIQTKRIYCITKDHSAAPASVRDRQPLFASQVQRNGGLESRSNFGGAAEKGVCFYGCFAIAQILLEISYL